MNNSGCSVSARSDFFMKTSEKRLRKLQQKHQQCMELGEGNHIIHSSDDDSVVVMEDTRSPLKSKKRKMKTTPIKNATVYLVKSKRQNMKTTPVKNLTGGPPKSKKQNMKTTPVKNLTGGPPKLKKRNVKNTPVKNLIGCKKVVSSRILSSSPPQSNHASLCFPDLRLEEKKIAEENSRIFAGKQIHPFFSIQKKNKKYLDTTEPQANLYFVERMEKDVPFFPIHVFEKVQDDVTSFDWKNWSFCDKNISSTIYGLQDTFLSIFEDRVEPLSFDNFQSPLDFSGKSSPKEVFLHDHCPVAKNDLQNSMVKVSPMFSNEQMTCFRDFAGMEYVMDDAGFSTWDTDFSNYSDLKQKILSLQERMMSYCLSRNMHPNDILWTNKFRPEKATEVCGNGESVKFLSEWLRLWHDKYSNSCKNYDIDDMYSDCDACQSDSENMSGDVQLQNILLVTGPVGSGKSAAICACAKEHGFEVLELNASDLRNGPLVLKIGEALKSHSFKWLVENFEVSRRPPLLNSVHGQSLDNGRGDKTLLVFDDVDITSSEDRGLVAAIQQLAGTAKQPIILTSNCDNPVLPVNLPRLQLYFNIPSPKELFFHANMFCVVEKANMQSHLIEKIIKCCGGDIRKTITNIQFWCQCMKKGKEAHSSYSPLLFDLDAAHHILPKIIPHSFPSQLSEMVENVISRSLFAFERSCVIMEVVEDEEVVREEIQGAFLVQNEKDNIQVKKDLLLSRNNGAHDFNTTCEFSSSPGRRSTRRKYAAVTSDSEDEHIKDEISFVPETQMDEEKEPEAFEKGESIDYTCFDSEISFVPETQMDEEEEEKEPASEPVSCSYGENRSNHRLVKQNSVMAKNDDKPVTGFLHGNLKHLGFWGSTNFNSGGTEVVEDSQVDNADAVTRGYQMLDECSRIDFFSRSESIKKLRSWVATDLVQETWRKLRSQDMDFRQHATEREKENSRAVNLAYNFCSLLSETDLLLSDCQHLLCDVLEVAAVPPEESKSFCCYDELLHMTSATAQHGFCLYAKNMASLQADLNTNVEVDLIQEMLASSNNTIAVGKLIGNNMATGRVLSPPGSSSVEATPIRCEEVSLQKVIHSVVPARSHFASKGVAMHEYLSFLGKISSSESARLSKGITETTNRRRWVSRHYLTKGAMDLSPADILLLDEYASSFKAANSSDGTFRFNHLCG